MKLISLQIHNFKGIKSLNLEPLGANMNIYGANAACKTTIADAYYWLLFGKDSLGMSVFDIFPHEAQDGVQPYIEGRFERLDGSGFTLGRSIKKNFVRKRGEATTEYKGNVQEFYIDGVPKKAGEFDTFIASLGGEDRIMILTNPARFPGKMKWQDRRKILLEVFARDMTEADVIERHSELAELQKHLGAMYTVQDVMDMTKAKRKKINGELKAIPDRIDELVRMRPEIKEDDPERPQTSRLAKGRMEAMAKIEGIKNGTEISNTKALISNIQADISRAKADYAKKTTEVNEKLERQSMTLRRSIVTEQDQISSLQHDISAYEKQITLTEAEVAELRKKCVSEKHKEFTEGCCPTCSRPYEPEQTEKLCKAFNLTKAEAIKGIQTQGKDLKGLVEDWKKALHKKQEELRLKTEGLPAIKAQLKKVQAEIVMPPPFEETNVYKTLSEKLAAAEGKLLEAQSASQSRLAGYEKTVKEIDEQLEKAREMADDKKTAAKIDQRIEELSAEEKQLGIKLAEADNLILLCERFTQLQADDFEKEINSHFQNVSWKLFDRQINGGVAPVCEAVVNGSEYNNSLNTAAKVNAGLDIINAFAEAWGESWPVFIDNAESVTDYMDIDAQVIKLYVSAADRALRVETEQTDKMALVAS